MSAPCMHEYVLLHRIFEVDSNSSFSPPEAGVLCHVPSFKIFLSGIGIQASTLCRYVCILVLFPFLLFLGGGGGS